MRALVIAISMIAASVPTARADAPVAVVVRSAGGQLAVARLKGQLADVGEVAITVDDTPLGATLDDQLGEAQALAERYDAKAVVWFVARGKGALAVAIATPGDHRLFVREIPRATASSVAEAAAVAARGALKAIAAGGSIGVEVPRDTTRAEPPEPPAPPAPPLDLADSRQPTADSPASSPTALELALGWQVALDGGADRGAHAIALRASVAHGAWAASIALADGIGTRRSDGDVALVLARSLAGIGGEYRLGGGVAIGALAGVVQYYRETEMAPVAATPPHRTYGALAQAELAWRWRPANGRIGVVARVALAAVAGAPELAVGEPTMVTTLGTIRPLQGCLDLAVFARLP